MVKPPKSSFLHRVFHYFHHSFWGFLLFLETSIRDFFFPFFFGENVIENSRVVRKCILRYFTGCSSKNTKLFFVCFLNQYKWSEKSLPIGPTKVVFFVSCVGCQVCFRTLEAEAIELQGNTAAVNGWNGESLKNLRVFSWGQKDSGVEEKSIRVRILLLCLNDLGWFVWFRGCFQRLWLVCFSTLFALKS